MSQSSSATVRPISVIIISLGVILLIINTIGLFLSMENNDLLTDTRSKFASDKTVQFEEFKAKYPRSEDETVSDYVSRLNQLINDAISHIWWKPGVSNKYSARIPIWENYILYLGSLTGMPQLTHYEYLNWEKAIERGIGLCSQHAIVMVDILEEEGIPSRIVHLKGHVVAEVTIDKDTTWVVDPDFGTILPHNMTTIENNPQIVIPYYSKFFEECTQPEGCGSDQISVDIFSKPNKMESNGIQGYSQTWFWIENISYMIKWLLPVLLLLFGYILLKQSRSPSK